MRIMGLLLILSPFLALFVLSWIYVGLLFSVFLFLSVPVIAGIFALGFYLLGR